MINAIFFYRISHWLWRNHIPVLPKLFTLLIFLLYNSKVPAEATIGKGTKLAYGGVGVIIHKDSVVGENCMIGQQVTLGGGNRKYPGVPVIGDNVYIAKGAIVFGGIRIGDNSRIGANAAVNIPVPAGCTAVGVPARIVDHSSDKG